MRIVGSSSCTSDGRASVGVCFCAAVSLLTGCDGAARVQLSPSEMTGFADDDDTGWGMDLERLGMATEHGAWCVCGDQRMLGVVDSTRVFAE